MNSLLKISAGILLCLPLAGCAGPGYYDPSTGMICGGEMYGPTNFVDDIKCSLSKHRAQRMNRNCCNPCDSCNVCDPCGSCNPCGTCRKGGFGKKLPGMLASGTFSYGSSESSGDYYPMDSYPTPAYAPQSSCPNCGPQGGTFAPESNMHESVMPGTMSPETYAPETYSPETYSPESGSPAPATVVPQKVTPHKAPGGAILKPAPAPAAEEPMSSYVPPALMRTPTVIPSSASPSQGARPVQWVPAQIH